MNTRRLKAVYRVVGSENFGIATAIGVVLCLHSETWSWANWDIDMICMFR